MEPTVDPWLAWREELSAWLLKRLRHPSLVEDLVQEGMLRFVQAQQAGEVIEQPRAWLYRVVRNLAADHVRRQRPWRQLGQVPVAGVADPRSRHAETQLIGGGDGHEYDRQELLQQMPLAFRQLPPEDQLMLWSRYHEQLDCHSMAVREGKAISTIKGRLYRARRRLRERLLEQARRSQGVLS